MPLCGRRFGNTPKTRHKTEAKPHSIASNLVRRWAMEIGLVVALWDTLMQTAGAVSLVVIACKIGKKK